MPSRLCTSPQQVVVVCYLQESESTHRKLDVNFEHLQLVLIVQTCCPVNQHRASASIHASINTAVNNQAHLMAALGKWQREEDYESKSCKDTWHKIELEVLDVYVWCD